MSEKASVLVTVEIKHSHETVKEKDQGRETRHSNSNDTGREARGLGVQTCVF